MAKNINAIIALKICQCQMSSDRGKGFKSLDLKSSKERTAMRYGYSAKTEYLIEALNLIRKNKSIFNYYVIEDKDQNGCPSILVYFEFKIDGMRHQVSFHTPLYKADSTLRSLAGSGRKTRWNREIGGSIKSCKLLIDYFDLKV